MQIPSTVSDECTDDLIELLFHVMPAVEPNEMVGILNCILRIVEREVRGTVSEERRRNAERVRGVWPN